MKTHSQFVSKPRAKSKTLAKQKMAIGMTSLLLLASGLLYCYNAHADTNVAGVEIEYIDDPDLPVDPVQDLLADKEATHENSAEDDLWARIKAGYALPDVESPYTSIHEQWYASRPDYVQRMVERSQRYLYHIVEEVQKRGMPTEIALLPMIESAYNPQAYSRSNASGIWQFVPATGKHFGLKQNWWVDKRRDVTAATNAALDYLQKLHGMFGSWDLALAAYNAGEGTVQRAIDKNRRLGLATDYQSLNLPPETRNYVPKLQAIKNIITDPEKFGLTIASMPNRPYFARVTSPKQIDAKLAAQLAGISLEEFNALNPSHNRPVIASLGEKHQLLLPVWAAERFADNLANYDKPLTSWQTYNAKRGERVGSIAKKFGTNASHLRTVNDLSTTGKLHRSRTMLVPAVYNPSKDDDAGIIDATEFVSNSAVKDAEADEPKTARRIIHKVKRGETLTALAAKYNTNTQTLMQLNGLRRSSVKAGQTLTIRASTTRKSTGSRLTNTKHSSYKLISARSYIRLK